MECLKEYRRRNDEDRERTIDVGRKQKKIELIDRDVLRQCTMDVL